MIRSGYPILTDLIREVLKLDGEILEIAKKIYKEQSLLIMSRGYNFATCLEGALKIKVILSIGCSEDTCRANCSSSVLETLGK